MITVLMSTYNGEKYLSEQIDSILNQTYSEIELFVRDDGSADNTIEILKLYANINDKIKWYTGENLGCGKSFFQLVLDAPESEYYAFSDQDDYWKSQKLKTAIDVISQYPSDTPVLYCSSVNPVDQYLKPYIHHISQILIEPSFGNALTMNIAAGCTFVFNKKLLDEFRKMKIDYIDIHDWALYRVVTAIGGTVHFDEVSYINYRQHGENLIGFHNSTIKHWKGRIKRFNNKEYRKIRHEMAKKVNEIYYENMPLENKLKLDIFVNYDKNLKSKIKLLRIKDFRMSKKSDNIILKILILAGMI